MVRVDADEFGRVVPPREKISSSTSRLVKLPAEGVYCASGFVWSSVSPRDSSPDLYRSRNGRAMFDQDGDPMVVEEPDDDILSEMGVRSLDDFLRNVREL